MCIVERLLMLKEGVMHLPELSLCASSLRCLRCMFSMRVYLGQWKVTKDNEHQRDDPSCSLNDWQTFGAYMEFSYLQRTEYTSLLMLCQVFILSHLLFYEIKIYFL